MLGHPASVDAMVKLSEDTVITGAADGIIRVVDVHPHRIRGVIGEHDGLPVENLKVTADGTLLGSCSHDKTVRFWNVTGVAESLEPAAETAAITGYGIHSSEAVGGERSDFFSDL